VPLTALVGPAGGGKTTRLIQQLNEADRDGREAVLFLCSDSSELRARPHVKAGGLMGSRTPGADFEITHFVSVRQARSELAALPAGAMAAFDEAGFFGTTIVNDWIRAERAGVEVVVSSLRKDQIDLLVAAGYSMTRVSIPCMLCGSAGAAEQIDAHSAHHALSLVVCTRCLMSIDSNRVTGDRVATVLDELQTIKPFPGEKRAYQPLYQIPADGWDFVRLDTPLRADIMHSVYAEYFGDPSGDGSGPAPTYLDLGCATGYFCEHMDDHGFTSTGVDIDEDFLRLARHVTEGRNGNVEYIRNDALGYIETHPDAKFDVTSSFATIQWVMAQSGLEAGLRCFDWIFDATRQMCVVEMGYSNEEIYSDKLPVKIDADWVRDTMRSRGGFDEVLFFAAAEHNTWRDQFIGLRNPGPLRPGTEPRLPIENEGTLVRQTGPVHGVWSDGWAGARSSFAVACQAPVSRMRVSGAIPDWIEATSRLRVSSSTDESSVEAEPGAAFEIEVAVTAERGDVIRPVIESDQAKGPRNEDLREISFRLESIVFD
jgi:SAM-dependent methyltransferase/thymidine kinase